MGYLTENKDPMNPTITQNRIGDRIAFYSEGVEIASLYDGKSRIVFDRCADIRVPLGLLPEIDYELYFGRIGLDVVTARMIDMMPVPDISA